MTPRANQVANIVGKVKLSAIIGMGIEEAREYLARIGYILRPTQIDGEPRIGTCEMRPNRVNVSVINDQIDDICGIG